jgi:hypothetical protein
MGRVRRARRGGVEEGKRRRVRRKGEVEKEGKIWIWRERRGGEERE